MPSLHLTDLSVRALKGTAATTYYWDTTTPAFGLRVGKRAKTWTVMRGRARERLTIGRYPDLSLTDARKEAKRLLIEPIAELSKSYRITFEAARDAFLDHYQNANTRYVVECTLKGHCKPLHGSLLADIATEDIERCLARIKGPSARLHAFRYLRAMFRWALRPPRRHIKHSPLEGYEPPGTDKRGTRILSDEELVRIWYASPRIFRLMILWGTRNRETCALEREWERDDTFVIPGIVTKNGRDHAVPVLPLARSIIAGASNQYVFPGRWSGHLTASALAKLKAEVMEKSETKDWQLRDIRRTFRSNMARLKVSRDICELLINHAPPVLDDIYDRYSYIEEKREALAKYEAGLLWLLVRT